MQAFNDKHLFLVFTTLACLDTGRILPVAEHEVVVDEQVVDVDDD